MKTRRFRRSKRRRSRVMLRTLALAAALTLAACASEQQRPGRTTPAGTAERAVEQETNRVIRSTIGRTAREIERGIWRR